MEFFTKEILPKLVTLLIAMAVIALFGVILKSLGLPTEVVFHP